MFPVGTGSIDVGTGGEKKLDYLLDASAVIDVRFIPFKRLFPGHLPHSSSP